MASRKTEPAAPLPESERKALSGGMTFALACAAALSAPTLFSLGRLIRYPWQLAWLLPAALDGYAGTSIWVGRRITRTHPAAKGARRNARLALAMSVGCNGLYHLLALAGASLPPWVPITVLVAVSSLPPFIVDRLLHLNAIANGTGNGHPAAPVTAAPQTPAAARQQTRQPAPAAAPALPPSPGNGAAAAPASGGSETPAAKPAGAAPPRQPAAPRGGNVVAFDTGRRSSADWATLALPLWDRHVQTTGSAPTAKELCALLRHAHPALSVPGSDRSERNIRAATEELAGARPSTTDDKIEREVG